MRTHTLRRHFRGAAAGSCVVVVETVVALVIESLGRLVRAVIDRVEVQAG